MKAVVFDPFLSTQASKAHEWVPIRVGTDGAVALGMINVILNELGIWDARYLPLAYDRALAEWPWACVVNTWYFKRATDEWVKKTTAAPLFHGRSALDRMLSGSLVDLADVRRYLDAQRGL